MQHILAQYFNMLQTDGRTDGRTDRQKQLSNTPLMHYVHRAIKPNHLT